MDALGNVNVNDPRVVATGPATIDPATGERYGASFPQFTIRDMVRVQKAVLDALGIEHLVAVAGPSMGGAQALEWAVTYPAMMDRAIAVISGPKSYPRLNMLMLAPVEAAIRLDPAWQGGAYKSEPLTGLRAAENLLFVAGSAPLYYQAQYPTRAAASDYAEDRVASGIKELDANDLIYQLDASRNYNPWPKLEAIATPVMWINSADDFINARNLPFPKIAPRRMKNARFRLIPETAETRGHGTHTWAKFWKADLIALLARSESGRTPKRGSR